ncbi:MAG: hypothetical protein ACO2YV_02115, partial [Pseudomonadales bacterium]
MGPDTFDALLLEGRPLLDVRAPIEFLKGAIPGATNHPLMNDDERARVGRCYKQEGHDAAVRLGHRLVSGDTREARIEAWAAWAKAHPTGALYCFRGGQRSQITQGWLAEAGYTRGDVVENPGEFAVRGGIFDVFPPGGSVPFRLDLFGDSVERIFEVDPTTQASDRRVSRVEVVGASLEHLESDADVELLPERMPCETVGVMLEIADITEQYMAY